MNTKASVSNRENGDVTLHIGATSTMPSHSFGAFRSALRAIAPPMD